MAQNNHVRIRQFWDVAMRRWRLTCRTMWSEGLKPCALLRLRKAIRGKDLELTFSNLLEFWLVGIFSGGLARIFLMRYMKNVFTSASCASWRMVGRRGKEVKRLDIYQDYMKGPTPAGSGADHFFCWNLFRISQIRNKKVHSYNQCRDGKNNCVLHFSNLLEFFKGGN